MKNQRAEQRMRQTQKKAGRGTEGWKDRQPRSVADYDKAITLIFCPSCCGSQEQLQWQGSICSAIPLLHSPSRSITNDTEKQGRSCRARFPAHAGATGGGGGMKHALREVVREDMLLASLVHQFMLKGMRDRQRRKRITHVHTQLVLVLQEVFKMTYMNLTGLLH